MEALTMYYPTRANVMDEFNRVQFKARMKSIWNRLFARDRQLESFRDILPAVSVARRYLGTHDVDVEKIIGSVDRSADFDSKFRPLGSHLRDRWVNIFLLGDREGWAPIRAYKVGQRYFVEDGHHRVSVARTVGMMTIRADVWEYPLKQELASEQRGNVCARTALSGAMPATCCG